MDQCDVEAYSPVPKNTRNFVYLTHYHGQNMTTVKVEKTVLQIKDKTNRHKLSSYHQNNINFALLL